MEEIFKYAPALRKELRSTVGSHTSDFTAATGWGQDFLKRLGPFATKGKMVRGSLVCFMYETFSQTRPPEAVIRTAVALELIHSALLIHDDIIDNDSLRRGQPSMHSQYAKIASKKAFSETARFGTSMALAGGDMVFFLAFDLLASLELEPHRLKAIKKLFTKQLIIVCGGQMQDVYLDANETPPSKQTIYRLMEEKTASYTIALPLLLGALLAGANASTQQKLRRFGVATGTIFQIRDDELGLMGEAKTIGKPVGSDAAEGKKTLLYYHLFKRCSPTERQRLRSLFGNPRLMSHDLAYIQQLIQKHDVPRLLQSEIDRLQARALAITESLPVNEKGKQGLEDLITYCAKRQA